jgi:cytochrome c551/c552
MKKLVIFAMLAVITLVIACSENKPDMKETPKTELSQTEMVNKGKYLVSIMGCNDCHSPKVMTPQGPAPDPERLLSGHPANEVMPKYDKKASQGWVLFNMNSTATIGPWGMSFAANLTPDDTGIANWTYENFEKAMRQGKFKGLEGSRMLMPPMPWQMLANTSDEDTKAIFAYLKSLKPINNVVPAPKTPDQI